MEGSDAIGRLLIVVGVVTALVGIVIVVAPQVPFLQRLPTIDIQTGNARIIIPIGAMLLISVLLTVILNVIGRR
jgi:hypothetical protein